MTVQDIVLEFPNIAMKFSEMSTEQRDEDSKYAADKICEVMELEIKKTPVDANGLKQYLLGNVGEEEPQLAIYWSTRSDYIYNLCIGLSYNESPCETSPSGNQFNAAILASRDSAQSFYSFKAVKNTKGSFFYLYLNSYSTSSIISAQMNLSSTAPNDGTFFKIDNIIYKYYGDNLYRRYPATTSQNIKWDGKLDIPLINIYKYNYFFPLQNGFTHEEFKDLFYLGTTNIYSPLEKILIDGKKYFIFKKLSDNHYYIALDEAGV